MTIAGAPLASAAEQNSAYARHKEGRFGKPRRPSLFKRLYKNPLQNSLALVDFPFTVPGYEHIPLTLRTGLFAGAKILYQGEPLKKVPSRKFVLGLADGTDLTLRLKISGLDLLVPQVMHNDTVIQVSPKLPAYQQVLVYLPFLLIFIGGICGGIGASTNLVIFHGSQNTAVKVILSILITMSAVLAWIVAVIALHIAIGR